MDMEFFVDTAGVNPQGVPCHAEFVGDFLHEVAFGQEGEDFVFAGGEGFQSLGF